MTLMKQTKGLFRHEVSDHVRSTNKEGLYITTLSMMAAEVATHIDVTGSGLIRRVEAHSDCAAIVAIQGSVRGVPKTECVKEHAKIESFLGALRERIVFSFLSAKAYSRAELYFPADAGTIEEEYIRARGASKVKIGSPIAVGVAVRECMAQRILSTENDAVIFRLDEIFRDAVVGVPQFLTRIVDIAS
jgi:hypothetical protein